MGKEITVKAIINNMPTEITYPYLVVRHVEDELWWYGQYEDYQRASDIALKLGNGFVLEKGEN